MQESWFLPWFGSWYAIYKYTLILCWLLCVAGCDVGDALAWAWSSAPGTCSAPSQVACPAPPWFLAPLLACPAPPWCLAYFLLLLDLDYVTMFTSFGCWFGLVVIIPPWCSAHEQGELCVLLVVIAHSDVCDLCWWCCCTGGGAMLVVVLCWWWCWSTRVSWSTKITHSDPFILCSLCWCLDTSLHALGDWAAC
jgi:hypothetical protein